MVSVSKGTLDAPALNYVSPLGICPFVWQRLGGYHADGRYEIPLRYRLVVWSTEILIYLSVLPFHIIISQDVRLYAHDFYRVDVGL